MSSLNEDQTYAVARRGLGVLPWISVDEDESTPPQQALEEREAARRGDPYREDHFAWVLAAAALWATGALTHTQVEQAMVRLAFAAPEFVPAVNAGVELRQLVARAGADVGQLSEETCAAVVLEALYHGAGRGAGELLRHTKASAL